MINNVIVIKMLPKSKAFLALYLIDAIFVVAFALIVMTALPEVAFAYVDPSIMTYTIQALAGVAVALSAVLGVVWRRVRKVVYKKLHIDENSGKLVEEDVARIDLGKNNMHDLLKEADVKCTDEMSLVGSNKPQNVKWVPRLVLSILACGFLVYTIGIVAPLEIIATGYESLVFGINNIFAPLVWFAVILLIVMGFAMSSVRGRAFNYILSAVVALGICFYIQGTFMNSSLPIADGTTVDWSNYKTITCLSLLVWVIVFFAFIYLAKAKPSVLKTTTAIVTVVLVLIQSVGLVSIFTNPNSSRNGFDALTGKPFVTQENLMEVTDGNDITVFILDMFDNDYLDAVLERYPDALEPFTGFTWFKDSSGLMIPTRYSVASMLTGNMLNENDEAFSNELLRSWYKDRNLLDALADAGYAVDVYSTEINNGIMPLVEKTNNVRHVDFVAPMTTVVPELWKCALYRDMPWILKWPFWFYTDDLNTAIAMQAFDGDTEAVPYVMDDAEYFDRLCNEGLELTNLDTDKGTFRFIHMMGSHYPITMNEKAERVDGSETDMVNQSAGSLLIVEKYIEELKRLGVYDQTTIIITADHGKWYLADEIDKPSSPILLVKPYENAEEAQAPLSVSYAPVGHWDLPSTILNAADADKTEFGSGMDVFEVPLGDRVRLYDATAVIDNHDYTYIKEWAINGNVQDWESWEKTGRKWPIVDD